MATEPGGAAPHPLAELFRVVPLPRWRAVFAITCAGAAFLCALPAPAQEPAKPGAYGEEDRDWNVPPTKTYRRDEYHGPTPREIPAR